MEAQTTEPLLEQKSEIPSDQANAFPYNIGPPIRLPPLSLPNKETPKIVQIKEYLNKKVRVLISDGRTLTGKFWCIDNGMNIVMGETEETKKIKIATAEHPDGIEKEDQRLVGLVTIPGKHIVKIEVEVEQPITLQISNVVKT